MGARSVRFLSIMCFFTLGIFFEAAAEAELKDTPYFSGMPNFRITESSDQEFSDYRFFNGKDCTTVEGKKYFRAYTLAEDAKQSSELQISRNYANAVKNMAGTVVFEGEISGVECAENSGGRAMIGKVIKGDNELWIEVAPFNDGNDYYLTVVVKEIMKQAVTANDMFEALNRDGRFTLNINFDAGVAVIKPEYKAIISQIAEMLKKNPDLKISVEGHTDGTGGDRNSNLALSDARATAVMKAIIAEGIDSKRLSAIGYGSDKPIADITTEEGRAKNRRVEIIKK